MRPKRKYYSIIDKVYRMSNLHEAWGAVKANKGSAGVDGETIQSFDAELNQNLCEIQRLVRENRYRPEPVLRQYMEKDSAKKRPLGIPTARDRSVKQAFRHMIEPFLSLGF